MTYYSRLAHAKREGEKKGKFKALKRNVLKMFQKVYPNEDTRFLEGLTLEQYDTLHDMIFDYEPLTTIKEYLNID